jgi:hypothetical protein
MPKLGVRSSKKKRHEWGRRWWEGTEFDVYFVGGGHIPMLLFFLLVRAAIYEWFVDEIFMICWT